MDLVASQRPEVEGPIDRYLFDTRERQATGVLPVLVDRGAAVLEGAPLFGIGEGDTYAIVAPGGDRGRGSGSMRSARRIFPRGRRPIRLKSPSGGGHSPSFRPPRQMRGASRTR
jgi:hypothetical protein